ncbi:MAG: mechanosensitive ion channel [Cytophagales bacterium]|nr:mechanosensitive ion channel [Cytophagales bacterium]
METEKILDYSDKAIELLWKYGPNIVLSIVILIVGLMVIRLLTNTISKVMNKRGADPSLTPFLKSLLSILLKAMLVVSVVGMVGIEVTSFVAIIGAAGLAIGLALQDTLQNFAGGVIILFLKPFRVGDFIEGASHSGTVSEIQIFNTYMKTGDNKTIIIPNAQLANSSVTNFSTEATRRVDWTFGIGYGDKGSLAREVLLDLIKKDSRIKSDPEPFIALSELAGSSVNFVVKVWVESGDYWDVFYDMNENVYNTFAEKGLNIPFPQMDVHLHK